MFDCKIRKKKLTSGPSDTNFSSSHGFQGQEGTFHAHIPNVHTTYRAKNHLDVRRAACYRAVNQANQHLPLCKLVVLSAHHNIT